MQVGQFRLSSGRGLLFLDNRVGGAWVRRRELKRPAAVEQRAALAAQVAAVPAGMEATAASPPSRQWPLIG